MKLFHISDIHIGKILHHYNLIDDQKYILREIVKKVQEEQPQVMLISGDIYDKSVPSAEAMSLFDLFLRDLHRANKEMKILIIAGNHDSGERLSYAANFLESQDIYIVGTPPKNKEDFMKKVVLEDEYGKVNFYLLPFFKPAYVKGALEEDGLSYDEAFARLIEREEIDYSSRNVLLAHQFFVAGEEKPITSDSEIKNVGGLDNIDVKYIKQFDYVALGHIHRNQKVGYDYIRYCGSPLKYSVSEAGHKKALVKVLLKEKGKIEIEENLLRPKRDLKALKGALTDFTSQQEGQFDKDKESYVSITLTDTTELFKPKEQLENVFRNILEIKVDNEITRSLLEDETIKDLEQSPSELFANFFREMQGRDLTKEEIEIIEGYINETY
ncbi:MAG TPA: exonuclease SbcCD subunit D [Candidatus Dorea intestinavium]|nr:exonuclease SbcCD subunit D [Candidatus Dorea intestinavium]